MKTIKIIKVKRCQDYYPMIEDDDSLDYHYWSTDQDIAACLKMEFPDYIEILVQYGAHYHNSSEAYFFDNKKTLKKFIKQVIEPRLILALLIH